VTLGIEKKARRAVKHEGPVREEAPNEGKPMRHLISPLFHCIACSVTITIMKGIADERPA
jgi:hypothetical protein